MDKLSAEVAQALASGMSYGMWKALQTKAVSMQHEDEKKSGDVCNCKYCGEEFVKRKRNNRIYCGEQCRQKAQYHYIPKNERNESNGQA